MAGWRRGGELGRFGGGGGLAGWKPAATVVHAASARGMNVPGVIHRSTYVEHYERPWTVIDGWAGSADNAREHG